MVYKPTHNKQQHSCLDSLCFARVTLGLEPISVVILLLELDPFVCIAYGISDSWLQLTCHPA